jgi:quinol-cytochrome oxidoreductase complex cytochrome b subunit
MSITEKAQKFIVRNMTLEDMLPTKMPVFVNSVAYLFGALTLSALVMLIVTGGIMVIFGPLWYHGQGAGHFINSLHFWSTQVFFAGLVLHFATKFVMAAWRDGRWKTWIVGTITFAVVIPTALTGFLSQTNWDSQWIAVQAKDALNSLGIGAYFNTLNLGQMLTLHIVFLPSLAVALVAIHLFLVRRDGPVKPIENGKNVKYPRGNQP